MKRSSIIRVFLLFLSFTSVSAQSNETEPPASSVTKVVEARSLAWIRTAIDRDIPAFLRFASVDYVLMWVEPATNGQKARWATRTRNEWAEQLQSGHLKYISVDLRNTKVFVHRDVAIFSGEYTERGIRDSIEYTDEGLFTETWVKREGQWIIVGSIFP